MAEAKIILAEGKITKHQLIQAEAKATKAEAKIGEFEAKIGERMATLEDAELITVQHEISKFKIDNIRGVRGWYTQKLNFGRFERF